MIGIIGADQGAWFWLILLLLALVTTTVITKRRARFGWPVWLACALALSAFAWRQASVQQQIAEFPFTNSLATDQSIEVSGTGWIASRMTQTGRSSRGTLHLSNVNIGNHTIPCDHRMPLWIESGASDISYGTQIRFTGLIKALQGPRAPGGFDPKSFYYRQLGALASIEIRDGDPFEILDGTRGTSLVALSHRLRDHLESNLHTGLKPADLPYAQLIAAMSLGARENSPEELENWFRLSGTMHLFAVSGLHVGIVAGILLAIALFFRIPKKWAALIIIPLILFYALLTGLRPSAVRAAVMLSIVLASFIVKERPRLLNSLAFAGLVLLAFNPQQLFLPGFQLSFAVLVSIILFSEWVQKGLAQPWLSDSFVPKTLLGPVRRFKDHSVIAITAALAISIVSWFGSVGPLTWHFQSFSSVGIVANLLMVPLASAMVTMAVTSLACFGLQLPWLGGIINQLNIGLATALTALAQFFAALPGAYHHTGDPMAESQSPPLLQLDVMGERGELANLLSFSDKEETLWMVDCGGTLTYQRQLLPLLRNRGINHLDALIITHGDQGHIGSAPALLSQLRPPLLFEGPFKSRSPVYPQIRALADSLGVQTTSLAAGQRVHLNEQVTWEVLAPSTNSNNSYRFADDKALVLKLTCHNWVILFTSDAGFETEKWLLNSGANLRSDLWIRGQHRNSPSALTAFVKAVSPRAVISTHSTFPSAERIPAALQEQLAALDVTLFELDRTGVVTVSVKKDSMKIVPFSEPNSALRLSTLRP